MVYGIVSASTSFEVVNGSATGNPVRHIFTKKRKDQRKFQKNKVKAPQVRNIEVIEYQMLNFVRPSTNV